MQRGLRSHHSLVCVCVLGALDADRIEVHEMGPVLLSAVKFVDHNDTVFSVKCQLPTMSCFF